MKKALLCVSFGTSVPAARESITAVEESLRDLTPDRTFQRAFTSPTIRRILQRRGEMVLSAEDALETLSAAGYGDVLVQPTHLLHGIEYEKLQAVAAAWSGRFANLRLGLPLLSNGKAVTDLATALAEAYQPRINEALVLLGHGTDHPANAVYSAMQEAFFALGRDDVCIGTVEGTPTYSDVSHMVKARGVKSVHLVPLMLVAGDHAQNDMAGPGADSWKSRLEAEDYMVRDTMQGLGLLPAVRELYRQRTKEAL